MSLVFYPSAVLFFCFLEKQIQKALKKFHAGILYYGKIFYVFLAEELFVYRAMEYPEFPADKWNEFYPIKLYIMFTYYILKFENIYKIE